VECRDGQGDRDPARGAIWYYSTAFSPDGARVITTAYALRLWDATKAEEIGSLRGCCFDSAAFSPDGGRVITVTSGVPALWDVTTAQQITFLRGGRVTDVAFSLDGTRVVTASRDGTARVWAVESIPKGNLFAVACANLPDHDLTDIAKDYGLANLEPICEGTPPLPDRLPQ
jgi:WD40 repeat protein